MRTDKAKNTAKVLKEVIKNPLSTEREIAEKTWISNWTAHNIKWELEQIWAKSQIILEICDLDINLVKKWLKELDRRFSDKEEMNKIRPTEISQVIKDSSWRYQIFKWKGTDENWGYKEIIPNIIINGNSNNQCILE